MALWLGEGIQVNFMPCAFGCKWVGLRVAGRRTCGLLDEKVVAHPERTQPIGRTRGAAVKAGGQLSLDAGRPN